MYGAIKTRRVGYKQLVPSSFPSRPTKYSAFYDLQGGINTLDPSHQIKNDQVSDAYNCDYSTWGLKTRNGITKFNASAISGAASVNGLYASYITATRVLMVADDKGKIYTGDSGGGVTLLASGLTSGVKVHFHDWRGKCFVNNGSDSMYKFDGTNFNVITNAPNKCTGSMNVESRLFAWGDSDNVNYLYFCDLNDEETWDNTTEYSGFLVVPQVKGDKIIGCAKQGRSIIVFKSKSIWKYHLNGLPRNWSRELISDSIGCASQWAIVNIQDVIFFMADDGRVYQLAESLKLISKNIDSPDTNRWGLPTDVNMSKRNETVGYYDPNQRKVRFIYNDVSATTDYPNMYADYYITRDAWLRGNLSASCAAVTDGSNDTNYIYVGSPTTGYIYRVDYGTSDDGSAIDSYFKTKDYDLGIVDVRKIFETAYISSKSVGNWNMTFTTFVDFDSIGTDFTVSQTNGGAVWDTAVWDTDTWGGEGLVRSRISLGNQSGHYISFRCRVNIIDKYMEVRGMGFAYKFWNLI